MGTEQAIDAVRISLGVMLVASAPILASGLLIGLAVSILQAVTQIQEQTLSFVPKIAAMGLVAMLIAPWLIQMLSDFSTQMFSGGWLASP